MLSSLSIKNVVLIDLLNIELQSGLCALTGETGAGKSILLDALGLALGARSDSGLVRKGEDQASVTAIFEIKKNHPAFELLRDADVECESPLILRRSVTPDGRSKAFINDQPVSVALLKNIGEILVEVHGQFETQGLLNPSTHREILDQYAEISADTVTAWNEWKKAESEYIRLKSESEQSRSDEEYLRQSVHDLDALAPQPGEEKTLGDLRSRLMHREKVLQALSAAHHALSAEDDPVRKASSALSRVTDKLGEGGVAIITALDRASAEIEDALAAIQSFSSDLQESEHSLETIDDRLHELKSQARKHSCAVDDLAAMRETLARRLNLIEWGDDLLQEAEKKSAQARKKYESAAAKASEIRKTAAKKLDALVARELPPLKMEKAKFVTNIETMPESEWGTHGWDRVRFLVATNPGSDPGPLNKIASGGEMARFMLALKVVMADVGQQSLIFDEVDTGIGGAVADAVGERLSRLAKNRQVMVVTHAPQVAARADHHFIVQKSGAKEIKTSVIALDKSTDRREEIARMLSGATITAEARAAAGRLLKSGT